MKLTVCQRPRGIALIIVMVVIVVLSILAAGFAYSMKVETRLARNASYESDLLWLARSGVELARYVVGQQAAIPFGGGYDALNQKWAGGLGETNDLLADITLENNELGPGRFSVRITDLERKVNINYAPREILQRALELMGCDSLAVATVLDSIEDWRDPNTESHMNGTESDYYLSLPRPYVAKDGPIDDLSELLLVREVSPEMLWGRGHTNEASRTWTTSPSESGGSPVAPTGSVGLADLLNTAGGIRININTASREVLQLLPGIDENLASGIVQTRAGLDGSDGTEDDTPFHNVGELINVGGMLPQFVQALQRFCDVRSSTFEARVKVQIDQYERTYVALLFRRGRDVQVLNAYWQ